MKSKNVETEVAGIIDKMQQQLAVLEKKIDILISHSSKKPDDSRTNQKPFQQYGHSHNDIHRSQGNNYAQRVMHKAICADCRKECEVPFKPTGERPVYCKECFSKRKSANSFKGRADSRPGTVASAQMVHIAKPQTVLKKKAVEKKKPVSKKRKSKAK